MGDADSMGRVLSMASMTRLAAKTILPSGNGLGSKSTPLSTRDLPNDQVRVQPFQSVASIANENWIKESSHRQKGSITALSRSGVQWHRSQAQKCARRNRVCHVQGSLMPKYPSALGRYAPVVSWRKPLSFVPDQYGSRTKSG